MREKKSPLAEPANVQLLPTPFPGLVSERRSRDRNAKMNPEAVPSERQA